MLGQIKPTKKGSNVTRYFGKLKWKGNPVKVQRSLRDED